MDAYYSLRSAAKWLAQHVNFYNQAIKVNTAYLKRLNQECRLPPVKSGIFGKRYFLKQLKKYVAETQPQK